MFIAYHLNKGYYSFTPKAEHVQLLYKGDYIVTRLAQNYYYNSKTGKVSRATKETGESFISFDAGAPFVRLPWFIPQGSESFYLSAIASNVAKMRDSMASEETSRRLHEATSLQVA